MAEMAEVYLIFASYRLIRAVDCFGPSSGPKCTESDFENVADGCVPYGGVPEMVARAREGIGTEILYAAIGFGLGRILRDCSISN